MALTARLISLGGGAEAPTGPLQGGNCLLVSLIPCWVRQAEQKLHPVDTLRGPSGRLQRAEGQVGTGVAYANSLRKFLEDRRFISPHQLSEQEPVKANTVVERSGSLQIQKLVIPGVHCPHPLGLVPLRTSCPGLQGLLCDKEKQEPQSCF